MANQQFDVLIEESRGKVREGQAQTERLNSRIAAARGAHSLGTSPI